jgi:hypothetical protein
MTAHESTTDSEYVDAPCNACLRHTRHHVLKRDQTEWSEIYDRADAIYISGGDAYALLKCAGCQQVRLEHRHWFSEHTDEHGRELIQTDYFPPTVTRRQPTWMTQLLPFDVRVAEMRPLFEEVYQAYAAGSFRLAVMGIRAIVERIMIDRVGDQGSFAKSISAFFDGGFIAVVQQPAFRNTLIEAGHAAMHRAFEPTGKDVSALLDVVEGIIDVIYFQPMRAASISERLPPRR